MGFRSPKAVEKGVFTSPALGIDTPYEVFEDESQPNGLAVRCVKSKEVYGTDVLAAPTQADLAEQYKGFVREVAAWLVANNGSPEREQSAVANVRQCTAMDYTTEDLHDDVTWVRQNDLSARMNLLGRHLEEGQRSTVVALAGAVAASSSLNETDARFIELVGAGLGLSSDSVAEIVMGAMNAGLRVA